MDRFSFFDGTSTVKAWTISFFSFFQQDRRDRAPRVRRGGWSRRWTRNVAALRTSPLIQRTATCTVRVHGYRYHEDHVDFPTNDSHMTWRSPHLPLFVVERKRRQWQQRHRRGNDEHHDHDDDDDDSNNNNNNNNNSNNNNHRRHRRRRRRGRGGGKKKKKNNNNREWIVIGLASAEAT